MVQTGQLVQWNDDRGFGFIEAGDGQRHFVHISAMGRFAGRPRIGDRVSFLPVTGPDGRPRASTVRMLGDHPDAMRRGRAGKRIAAGPDWRLPALLALLVLLAAAILLERIPVEMAFAYAVMSLLSLIAYRMDKLFASTGQWRTSEATLLGIDLCLGLPGGLLGQALFRHKTRKPRYVAATVLTLAAHLLWLAAFASGLIDADIIAKSMSSLLAGGAQVSG